MIGKYHRHFFAVCNKLVHNTIYFSSDEENVNRTEKPEIPRVQGELELDDLPPIEDLAISLPAQETTKIGTIASIVDRLGINH